MTMMIVIELVVVVVSVVVVVVVSVLVAVVVAAVVVGSSGISSQLPCTAIRIHETGTHTLAFELRDARIDTHIDTHIDKGGMPVASVHPSAHRISLLVANVHSSAHRISIPV